MSPWLHRYKSICHQVNISPCHNTAISPKQHGDKSGCHYIDKSANPNAPILPHAAQLSKKSAA